MFEPKLFPYMRRGRWFEFRIVSDGKELCIGVNPSLDASASGGYIKLPAGFHIIDVKYDISFLPDAKSEVLTPSIKTYAGGVQAFPIPKADKFDHLTAWVFANYYE